ncbi:MAG TPA: hypothetical protein VJT31_32415 [Rugosimonospora sp.]|nr:hypothetical protein [Rugosimonospora sp.]
MTDDPGDLVVSLQDVHAATDASAGHLVHGVLAASDIAVFPLPDGLDVDPMRQLQVLVAPDDPGDRLVERIQPMHLWLASLQTAAADRVLVIRLAHESRYGRGGADATAAALREAFEEAGEVWAGLHRLGLVPERPIGAGADTALAGVAAAEARQLAARLTLRLEKQPADLADCPLSPLCR